MKRIKTMDKNAADQWHRLGLAVVIVIAFIALACFADSAAARMQTSARFTQELLGTNEEVPAWFCEELFSTKDYADVKVSNEGALVGFTMEESPHVAFALLSAKLEQAGWSLIESGISGSGSFSKNKGECRWAWVSCTNVANSSSVVVQVARTATTTSTTASANASLYTIASASSSSSGNAAATANASANSDSSALSCKSSLPVRASAMPAATVFPLLAATSLFARLRGLLRANPKDVEGRVLMLAPCKDIHTFGMCENLDIAFIGSTGEVLSSFCKIKPSRRLRCRKASLVLERISSDEAWFEVGDKVGIASVPARSEKERKC